MTDFDETKHFRDTMGEKPGDLRSFGCAHWQLASTAPKGIALLLHIPNCPWPAVGWRLDDGAWVDNDGFKLEGEHSPSHWMALPDDPDFSV